jgi:hypothetical protein
MSMALTLSSPSRLSVAASATAADALSSAGRGDGFCPRC